MSFFRLASFSLSLFLLLDEPQPRKTNGEDHHHDENGVVYHRSCSELMFTDQDCFRISLGLDLHQELLAFHDLDRQPEINQPRLQKGQRQHVLRVDIMGAVAPGSVDGKMRLPHPVTHARIHRLVDGSPLLWARSPSNVRKLEV